jgi:hypothetical protein
MLAMEFIAISGVWFGLGLVAVGFMHAAALMHHR